MTFITLGEKIDHSEVLDTYQILHFRTPSSSKLDIPQGYLKIAEL